MKEFICTVTFVIFVSLSCAKETNTESKTMESKSDMAKEEDNQIGLKKEEMLEIMTACNDSFRIEMAYVDALEMSGSFPDETDRTPKCFVRCAMEGFGVASEAGVYDPKVAAKVLAGSRGGKVMTDLEDLATACATRDEQCKCERAYQFVKCLMEKEIEEYEKSDE